MATVERALASEIEAAKIFLEQIRAIAEGDETLVMDSLEGETTLFELIALLDDSEAEDQMLLTGLKAHIEKLEERERRIKARVETKRTLLAAALDLAGKKKHQTALGTISVSQSSPIAIVTDEAEIPARFWKPNLPTLDKRALNEAVKAGEVVPGTTVSNGSLKISIRR
jgi:hypothetical protein